MVTRVSSCYTMITVFVDLHIKLLTCLYQCFSIIHCLLEMNIIIGVDNQDFEKAIRVLYNSFVK